MIHDVAGMDSGIWFYHPPTDEWSMLRHGTFRREAFYLTLEQQPFGQCSAVCWMTANLKHLMNVASPDIYRLAHLEAGIVTNRLALSAEARTTHGSSPASSTTTRVRMFLGILRTRAGRFCATAVGSRARGSTRCAIGCAQRLGIGGATRPSPARDTVIS